MYNASVDYFEIFEPDFFVKFHSNEIINYQKEEEELVRGLITHEWPWPIAYWDRSALLLGRAHTYLSFLVVEIFHIYTTIELAQSATQMAERSAIVAAAENGGQNAFDTLEHSSHVE